MDHFLGRNDDKMQCRGILHIVKAGDTLYKIGKEHGVPVSRIMYANPYVDIYNLQIGDEICVPVMTPRTQQTAPAIQMPAVETPARGWQAPPPTPISERYGEDWQETMPETGRDRRQCRQQKIGRDRRQRQCQECQEENSRRRCQEMRIV